MKEFQGQVSGSIDQNNNHVLETFDQTTTNQLNYLSFNAI